MACDLVSNDVVVASSMPLNRFGGSMCTKQHDDDEMVLDGEAVE
jgi:hypothetical protein